MNRTPLHDVALDGLVTFIFRFVEIGMDISATDTNGRTPLDEAKEGLRSGNWHHILSETENDKEALVSSALVALGEERSKANRFTAAAVRVQRWFLGEKLEHNLYGILEELYDKEWPRKNPSALVFAARFRMSKLHEDRRKFSTSQPHDRTSEPSSPAISKVEEHHGLAGDTRDVMDLFSQGILWISNYHELQVISIYPRRAPLLKDGTYGPKRGRHVRH
ncbi:hypothetical protein MMC10_003495 [Thelotrema lepadinum]|nr:hypothetical protein [Thelotrema lepadinum]